MTKVKALASGISQDERKLKRANNHALSGSYPSPGVSTREGAINGDTS